MTEHEKEQQFEKLIKETELGDEFTRNVDFLLELFERTFEHEMAPTTLSKDHLIKIYQAAATLLNAQMMKKDKIVKRRKTRGAML
jgi:hypothetical protein